MTEFIAYDHAGWNDRHERFTHVPSGKTLLSQPHWSEPEYLKRRLDWYRQFDASLTVHACPGSYSTDGRLLGTVGDICERIEAKLRETFAENA